MKNTSNIICGTLPLFEVDSRHTTDRLMASDQCSQHRLKFARRCRMRVRRTQRRYQNFDNKSNERIDKKRRIERMVGDQVGSTANQQVAPNEIL